MSATKSPPASVSNVSLTLANNRLGVPAVVFFVISAATPLTVVSGVVTTGFATTGLLGIPVAFLVIGVVLALFSIGYVAMARHVANAGAFYAYIAQGLGRPLGVGGAWIALLAYNALQVGLYGLIGAAASPLLDQWFGFAPPWWLVALVAWAVVAVLGLLRVDVNGSVLAVLLCAEVAVIVLFSVVDLGHADGGTISTAALDPGNLFQSGVGAILALAVLGFVGFESSVVFAEESKDPKRTVAIATFLSVGLIAALYAFASWSMTVAIGPDNVVETSRAGDPSEVIFTLASQDIGPWAADLGHALLLTSVVAAMISFHNTTARYMFALGRERVLPSALGRTSLRTGAPILGSTVQSAIGLLTIVVYAVAGWDPLVQLFFWGGTSGGLGVLVLIFATAISVVVYFLRNPAGENVWQRLIAPALAIVAVGVVLYLAVANFATLLGVEPSHPLRWGIPGLIALATMAGVAWGLVLKRTKPEVYAAIGLGAKGVSAGLTASARR
jgi:amino acid transporter